MTSTFLVKPHGNSILANLPAEDQQRLHEWNESHTYEQIISLAAKPRPEGLDLKTSLGSLSRYFTTSCQDHFIQARLEIMAVAENLAPQDQEQKSKLQPVLLQTIEEKALRELLDANQPLANQVKVTNTVLRLANLHSQAKKAQQKDQDLDLKRQARKLAARRHELQLLKTFRDHFPVLSRVNWESESQDAQTLQRLIQLFSMSDSSVKPNDQ